MDFFGTQLNLTDMPTYAQFKNSPNHLYSAMQDTLAQGLSRSMIQPSQTDTQMMGTKEHQPSAWSK